ncbi:MAG: putative toxin-antitoxin system toxin component, PIN family [Anaerolineales bacterium]
MKPRPLRAVLDTNLLVSYLLVHRPSLATLLDVHLVAEHFILITAPVLLRELARVLHYPRLQHYYDAPQRDRFVALVAALSEVVELPADIPAICRDPDDDRVIACAVVGRADVIVSGDKDLLTLKRVGRIPILTAAEFLERLQGSSS